MKDFSALHCKVATEVQSSPYFSAKSASLQCKVALTAMQSLKLEHLPKESYVFLFDGRSHIFPFNIKMKIRNVSLCQLQFSRGRSLSVYFRAKLAGTLTSCFGLLYQFDVGPDSVCFAQIAILLDQAC